jgi:hypothetical protein
MGGRRTRLLPGMGQTPMAAVLVVLPVAEDLGGSMVDAPGTVLSREQVFGFR